MEYTRQLRSYSFLPPSVAEKYNLDIPEYTGVDQIVELPAGDNVKVSADTI